jgi:hypothetical protein
MISRDQLRYGRPPIPPTISLEACQATAPSSQEPGLELEPL